MKKSKYSKEEAKILEIALKYKLAYDEIYEHLPKWKQEIISANTGQFNNDRVVKEFAHEVCRVAEEIKETE